MLRSSRSNQQKEIQSYYAALYREWGPQHWWPAETQFEVIVGAYLTQNTAWINVERALENLRRTELLSLDGIRAVKLSRLSRPTVEAFKDKLLETRSCSLARKVLGSLKSIISEAMRRGLVAQNTAASVSVDTKKREQRKLEVGRDVPSKEEFPFSSSTPAGAGGPSW